jgi:AcrR family transcriptional regulator
MPHNADPAAKIALLSAAEAVFADKGVEAAKVEDITRRAGVSKGAFYLHFEGKEEAVKQLCETFLARCERAISPPEETPEVPTELGAILAFALDRDVAIFELLWQDRAIVAILQSCHGPLLYLREAFRSRARRTSEKWVNFFKRRGLFRLDIDTAIAAALVCGAYNELALTMLGASKKPPIDAWLREAQSTFMRGLGTDTLLQALDRRAKRRLRVAPRPRRGRAREASGR